MDLFRRLESRLPGLGRRELGGEIAPLLERLQSPLPPAEVVALCEAALSICRRLYAVARSADALPIARVVLARSTATGNRALMRRASTACGLLSADTADVVGALEYHVQSLRVTCTEGDRPAMSGIWNNIGLAMAIAGNYEMAVRCYQRTLALVEGLEGPVFSRFAACSNLSNAFSQLGDTEEGLRYASLSLLELTPAFQEQDPQSVILLRRNLVRLLIAAKRVAEAEPHVSLLSELAEQAKTPRVLIAAATARALYELATGRSDVALTRLDQALSRAREVPAVLRDTLAWAVRAEEAAGNTERALVRLQELSDHFYRFAVDRARAHLDLEGLDSAPTVRGELQAEQDRARLVSKVAPRVQPEGWETLRRLAVSAVLRMDGTGWHGVRVGALTKGLALAWGCPALQALEYGLAAELHDIGMMSVPEAILAKRDRLNESELALVRRHADAGAEILRDDRHPRLLVAREIAKYHHARWDGNGFPGRVGGRFIPLPARMCAIADAYDAMVSGLCGRPAMTMDAALGEITRCAGTQFDPEMARCFDAFIRSKTDDRGVDRSSGPGMEGFQELIQSLQEDRGFI
jgi:putative two-component system response regulator